ncbi:hypothetical protein HMPREF2136_01160 [Prevotella bivia DNF00650]|jgi:hypothetical protein|uniref:Uncharacterized protein n=1 Tax=Prevotella bivia TaxID=28125 RepID=A0A137STW8_9BACT|nr:hypothetical protein HMPREF2136_01160 [Prevotella bivia DNF00650]KXO15924.1 hypothetical protein HMPREF3202_01503 [Prevotella bivia]
MLRSSALKFLGEQAVKKGIYSLIKKKMDDRKERLTEIRIVVVCFQMQSFALITLLTSFVQWQEHQSVSFVLVIAPQAAT